MSLNSVLNQSAARNLRQVLDTARSDNSRIKFDRHGNFKTGYSGVGRIKYNLRSDKAEHKQETRNGLSKALRESAKDAVASKLDQLFAHAKDDSRLQGSKFLMDMSDEITRSFFKETLQGEVSKQVGEYFNDPLWFRSDAARLKVGDVKVMAASVDRIVERVIDDVVSENLTPVRQEYDRAQALKLLCEKKGIPVPPDGDDTAQKQALLAVREGNVETLAQLLSPEGCRKLGHPVSSLAQMKDFMELLNDCDDNAMITPIGIYMRPEGWQRATADEIRTYNKMSDEVGSRRDGSETQSDKAFHTASLNLKMVSYLSTAGGDSFKKKLGEAAEMLGKNPDFNDDELLKYIVAWANNSQGGEGQELSREEFDKLHANYALNEKRTEIEGEIRHYASIAVGRSEKTMDGKIVELPELNSDVPPLTASTVREMMEDVNDGVDEVVSQFIEDWVLRKMKSG